MIQVVPIRKNLSEPRSISKSAYGSGIIVSLKTCPSLLVSITAVLAASMVLFDVLRLCMD